MVDSAARLIVPRFWLLFTAPIALAVGVASYVGVFAPATYAKETASWAAQGAGQDLANLFVVVPVFLFAAHRAHRGSVRALLVWQGALVYVVYSYVLYAFYVHFNALFLVYVAALGLSFYALAGSIVTLDLNRVRVEFERCTKTGGMSALLLTVGILFAALWLSDIVRALALGTVPASATEVGLPVNPIHVLDLGLLLPGVVLSAVLLRRRNAYGFVFAALASTFLTMMGVAIIAMVVMMRNRGVAAPLAMPIGVSAIVIVTGYMTFGYLRECGR